MWTLANDPKIAENIKCFNQFSRLCQNVKFLRQKTFKNKCLRFFVDYPNFEKVRKLKFNENLIFLESTLEIPMSA